LSALPFAKAGNTAKSCGKHKSPNQNPGRIYDEARRGVWLDVDGPPPEAAGVFRIGEWNHYRVIAQGDRIQTFVNGVPIADIRDSVTARGFIGLHVHSIKGGTGPFSVRFRNIGIRRTSPGSRNTWIVHLISRSHRTAGRASGSSLPMQVSREYQNPRFAGCGMGSNLPMTAMLNI
jgi:hypothetical protein